MLKMKCSNCQEMIVSKLLAEIDQIHCNHCGEVVPVTDVMVYAKGFTFHRNDLAKRLFRYKSLIHEVMQEKEQLEKNSHASAESKKSLDQFLAALREVMDGARNSLRLDFSDPPPVSVACNQQRLDGLLINLSTSGAHIAIRDKISLPKKKTAMILDFVLPGGTMAHHLNGVVVWSKMAEQAGQAVYDIGLEFKDLDKAVVKSIWEFIVDSVSDS